MPRSPPPSNSRPPYRSDLHPRSRSPPGRWRGEGDSSRAGGPVGRPSGGWERSPPRGDERRYGPDHGRRSDFAGGGGQGPSSVYRDRAGPGAYGHRDEREWASRRGEYAPPAPMGDGRYDGRGGPTPAGRGENGRDRVYGPTLSYNRRSPSPVGGFRRRSPSPPPPTRGGGRPLGSMFDLAPAAGARVGGRGRSRSRSRSKSPVKASGSKPAVASGMDVDDEAEEGEVVEPSPSAPVLVGSSRRSPPPPARRADYNRRSPEPSRPLSPDHNRAPNDSAGGGRPGPPSSSSTDAFRRPTSPGPGSSRADARWAEAGGAGPPPASGSGRRSPSPVGSFRRFRSPSPPVGGGGWRRTREPSPPPFSSGGRGRFAPAYPPARRSPPPPLHSGGPIAGGTRYRSPSPRNEPFQRRRFRSPSPRSRGGGAPRTGAWAGGAGPEGGFGGRPPIGAHPQQQQGSWPHQRASANPSVEPHQSDRRPSESEDVVRPVGGDEWAARMKARQDEKDRLRKMGGGGEPAAATTAPAVAAAAPADVVAARVDEGGREDVAGRMVTLAPGGSSDDRRPSPAAHPSSSARALPLTASSTPTATHIADRQPSPDRPPPPTPARFEPPSQAIAAAAPPVRRAPSPPPARRQAPPPPMSSSNDHWQQATPVVGSRWKGRPDNARSSPDKASEDLDRPSRGGGHQSSQHQQLQQHQQYPTAEEREREREQQAAERERERLEKVVGRLAAGLVQPTPATGSTAAVARELAADLARTTASLSQLRAEHGKLTWAVWRAEQDVKDGEVERLAAVARRVAAEEGLKP